MKKPKPRKSPDAFKEVRRAPKTKRDREYPYENWMDWEKRQLSRVKRSKRKS